MSDTPRTDGAVLTWNLNTRELVDAFTKGTLGINAYNIDKRVVPADFARQLETELAAEKARVALYEAYYKKAIKSIMWIHEDRSIISKIPPGHSLFEEGIPILREQRDALAAQVRALREVLCDLVENGQISGYHLAQAKRVLAAMSAAAYPDTVTKELTELRAKVTELKDWQNRGEYAERLAAELREAITAHKKSTP